MTHSKSVSWHVSPMRPSLIDGDAPANNRARQNQLAEHPLVLPVPMSPTKRARSRSKVNAAHVLAEEPEFKFPSSKRHSLNLSETQSLRIVSPDADDDSHMLFSPELANIHDLEQSTLKPAASPYIIDSQPSLQEIFIQLANKERRVLEAREQLGNAEAQLSSFKTRWRSILSVPESRSVSGTSSSSTGSKRLSFSPPQSPTKSSRLSELHLPAVQPIISEKDDPCDDPKSHDDGIYINGTDHDSEDDGDNDNGYDISLDVTSTETPIRQLHRMSSISSLGEVQSITDSEDSLIDKTLSAVNNLSKSTLAGISWAFWGNPAEISPKHTRNSVNAAYYRNVIGNRRYSL